MGQFCKQIDACTTVINGDLNANARHVGHSRGLEGQRKIAILLYPGFTALGLVGPQYMFGNLMGAQIYLVSSTLDTLVSDTNLAIVPNTTYQDVPKDLDILLVPGAGSAIFDVINDPTAIAFIQDRASRAKSTVSIGTP